MKHKIYYLILLVFTAQSTVLAQEKKWTLQECVAYALEHNISVRQSELDLKVTEITKKDALGNFLPSANISASHSWNTGLTQNPITGINQQLTTSNTSANASVQVDLYKGLQNQLQFQRAKMAILANKYQLQQMKEDVALNVANAYLQILFNKENLKVQQQQLQEDQRQRERTQQLLDGGSVPRGDLLDVEATVAADKQRVIESENQLLISRLTLAQLLQLEDFQNFDIVDEGYDMGESEIMLQTPSTIYQKAKDTQTSIKLAEANLDVAEKDVKIATRAYQPTLGGFYNLNMRATSLISDPFLDQFWDYKGHTYGFQLNIPIFNGLTVRNNVARAKVALERSELAYDQQALDLERNVYTAYTDAQGALKAYEAAVSAADAREQALEYANERYEVGLINVFDFNQAQTLSVNSQSEVLRTKYDYIFKIKILEYYFGIPIIQKQ
ncbi:TolC family protein [Flavobacterium rhizosphaerae]|uniref:TolC family protein n=1 Tax=Flavobacterium rhizosphaerae TaxID=3163298 RepID=A0ABW8YUP5_9FLAO